MLMLCGDKMLINPSVFWDMLKNYAATHPDAGARIMFVCDQVVVYRCCDKPSKNFVNRIKTHKGPMYVEFGHYSSTMGTIMTPELEDMLHNPENEKSRHTEHDILIDRALTERNKSLVDIDSIAKYMFKRVPWFNLQKYESMVAMYNIPVLKSPEESHIEFEYFATPKGGFVKYNGAGFAGVLIILNVIDPGDDPLHKNAREVHRLLIFRDGKLLLTPIVYYDAISSTNASVGIYTGFPEFKGITFRVDNIYEDMKTNFVNNFRVVGSSEYHILMQIAEQCDEQLFAMILAANITDNGGDVDVTDIIDMDYVAEEHLKLKDTVISNKTSKPRRKINAFGDMLENVKFTDTVAERAELERLRRAKRAERQMKTALTEQTRKTVNQSDIRESLHESSEESDDEILDEIPSTGIVHQAQLFKFLKSLIGRFGNMSVLQIVGRKGSHVQVSSGTVKSTLVLPHHKHAIQKSHLKKFLMNFV